MEESVGGDNTDNVTVGIFCMFVTLRKYIGPGPSSSFCVLNWIFLHLIMYNRKQINDLKYASFLFLAICIGDRHAYL